MEFRLASDRDSEAWERFVAVSPHASFAHSFRMKAVYERVYGYPTPYWMGEDAGRIVAVCPLATVHSLLHWNRALLVSLPMVTAAGILASDAVARYALAARLAEYAAAGHTAVQLRGHARDALPGAATFAGYVTFTLDMDGADCWSGLSSRNRGKIRKSRRAGNEVAFGGRELLDDFFALHLRRSVELATPPYPKLFFAALLDAFPQAEIALARHAGRPVAAMFNIGYEGVMNYVFGCSDSRNFETYPNNHLFYEFLERARAAGYARTDFGRSPVRAGTYAFKQQWNATEVPLAYQYLGPRAAAFAGMSIQDVRGSHAFRVFARAWRGLVPASLAARLGPALIKRMPLA